MLWRVECGEYSWGQWSWERAWSITNMLIQVPGPPVYLYAEPEIETHWVEYEPPREIPLKWCIYCRSRDPQHNMLECYKRSPQSPTFCMECGLQHRTIEHIYVNSIGMLKREYPVLNVRVRKEML